MDKVKGILIVVGVMFVMGIICSASSSALLDNSSHALDSLALVKSMDTIKYQVEVINKQSTGLIIAIVVLAVVLLALTFFGARAFGALKQMVKGGAQWGGEPRQAFSGPLPYISLSATGLERIRRLPAPQKRILLEQLTGLCAILEADLQPRRGLFAPRAESSNEMTVYHEEVNW